MAWFGKKKSPPETLSVVSKLLSLAPKQPEPKGPTRSWSREHGLVTTYPPGEEPTPPPHKPNFHSLFRKFTAQPQNDFVFPGGRPPGGWLGRR
jgi:hypothetical protein